MEAGTVPVLSIAFMILDMVLGTAVPVFLFFFFKKKMHGSGLAFAVGCLVFLLFALILEQLAHFLFLYVLPFGTVIQGNIFLYALYGGIMAGAFEETGRYLAFRTVLAGKNGNDGNALMYGAGHGGFEMFMLLTIGMINNLVYSLMMNSGNVSVLTNQLSGENLSSVQAALEQLSSASPFLFLLSPAERLAALAAQLSFSVLVWFAAKKKGRYICLYFLAILFHLILDAGAAILNHFTKDTWLVELAVWAMSAGIAAAAVMVWKRESRPAAENENPA